MNLNELLVKAREYSQSPIGKYAPPNYPRIEMTEEGKKIFRKVLIKELRSQSSNQK